jgi:hypothetical protein
MIQSLFEINHQNEQISAKIPKKVENFIGATPATV